MDLILIPAILHIDPLHFAEYPPLLQERMRDLLALHIQAGHGLNTDIINPKG